ncbi:MAG: helix-turn-helix domain-containing protein [Longimicrobiales bacterium]
MSEAVEASPENGALPEEDIAVPRAGRALASSLLEYEEMVGPWAVSLTQLAPGQLSASLDFLATDNIILVRESRDLDVGVEGEYPVGFYTLGATISGAPVRIHGQTLDQTALGLGESGQTLDGFLPGGGSHWELMIPESILPTLAEEWHVAPGSVFDAGVASVDPQKLRGLSRVIVAALNRYRDNPLALEVTVTRDAVEQSIVAALFDSLTPTPKGGPRSDDPSLRRRAFRDAMEAIRQSEDSPRIPELARLVGVSQRTLQYAFQSAVGITPVTYLRRHRMHGAHRQLMKQGPGETSVSRAALTHGFTELGRFAVEYRTLFGQSPSQTLRTPYTTPAVQVADAADLLARP